jgi:hypothetical protein
VTGGLWPAELSTITAETATLAEHLKADLQRIAHRANDQLKTLKRAGMTEPARHAAEARVLDEARVRAVRRVESTVRYLHAVKTGAQARPSRPQRLERSTADLEKTQVLPVISHVRPVVEAPAETAAAENGPAESAPQPPRGPGRRRRRRAAVVKPVAGSDEPEATQQQADADAAAAAGLEETQVIPVIVESAPVFDAPAESATEPDPEPADSGRHHAVVVEPVAGSDEREATQQQADADAAAAAGLEETQVIPVIVESAPVFDAPAESATEPDPEPADSGRHHAEVVEPAAGAAEPEVAADTNAPAPAVTGARAEKSTASTEFDINRLNRLLEFVVRQEPRLNWAIGDQADGTTVLVTDLAHGWIPAGITLPAGVRLLEPERRSGRVAALIGETARVVTYAPGASLRRSADFAATRSSVEPRQLPPIAGLGRALSEATRGRDELPRIVPRLAEAAAAGTVVVDQEVDVLRVHLDTARYQLMVQYPNVNPALLLKCLLMAATEGIASGDTVSANYHLAWYQKLAAPTLSDEAANAAQV